MKPSDKFKLTEQQIDKLENIRKEKYKENKNFTQEKLAKDSNVSLDDYKRFIGKKQGNSVLERYQIENLAKTLGIQPTDIIEPREWKGEKLFKYTKKFDALIEEKTRRFVGRKFVFDGFQDFLKNQ